MNAVARLCTNVFVCQSKVRKNKVTRIVFYLAPNSFSPTFILDVYRKLFFLNMIWLLEKVVAKISF